MGLIKYRIMAKKFLKSPIMTIYTEEKNISWLQYLTDEFCRIERANFSISIKQFNPESRKSNSSIYYLRNVKSDIFQSKHEEIKIDRNRGIINLKGFQIISGTISNKQYWIKYDLFWNAFFYLSRLQEFEMSQKGYAISSYSSNTQMPKTFIWDIPHVNKLFKELKNYLKSRFPQYSFETPKKAILELSHDLDYINKTLVLVLKQSGFNFYNALAELSGAKFINSIKFALTKANYWNFDYWQDIENGYNKKSTFYIYSRINRGFREYLFDPSYDIKKNKKLQSKLIEMNKEGWQIGLHGSFYSFKDFTLLKKEKDQLENAINISVSKNRQHWLCYDELKTPFYHEKLFETDSTIGWNDQIGFRAGIASKYRPYNHLKKKPFNHFVVPQVIMDSNIYDYGSGSESLILKKCIKLINLCKDIKNTEFSISWHPRTCSNDYNWGKGYEAILDKFCEE